MSTTPPATDRLDAPLLKIASVVILGTIMSILDTTIVNVAIRHLISDFHSTISTIQWVSTGYMLALATVIPLSGWAVDRFGAKRLYMLSIVLFLVGSALAGAAWSDTSLIAFRVLQGLGGGMIMPVGMTILTRAAGPQRMGRVMGAIGVPMLMAPIAGPILGGYLVDDVSWRWIFYVNLPIGAIALFLATRFLERDVPSPHERLDVLGAVLLPIGLAAFVYGLAETASRGNLSSPGTVAPLVAGVALIVAFVLHALRKASPLIDLRLFRNRTFAASAGTNFLLSTGFFGAMFLIPLYFQLVRGESALQAGLLIAPQGLGAAIAMPIGGRVTDRVGPGRVVIVGLGLIAAGMLSLSRVGVDTSYPLLGVTLFVLGLGMGSSMMPAMSAALATLSRESVARASTALNIVQRVGGSLGVAILSVVLARQLPGGNAALGEGSSSGGALPAGVQHTLAGAFGTTFLWGFVLLALAIVPALLLPRRRRENAASGGTAEARQESEEQALAMADLS
jgi:EmrB/QacA subfamily drug resistance transporter